MQIPVPLPPNLPGFDVTVTQVKSLRPDMKVGLRNGGSFQHYCEHLTGQPISQSAQSKANPP
jgi:beta-galactosidase